MMEQPARFHRVVGYVRAVEATNAERHVKEAGHGGIITVYWHGWRRIDTGILEQSLARLHGMPLRGRLNQARALRRPHTPAALRDWADKLRTRFDGAPIAVCIELSQRPVVYALREHDFFVLFPVQPKTLPRYREAFTTSGAKDLQKRQAPLLEVAASILLTISRKRGNSVKFTGEDQVSCRLRRSGYPEPAPLTALGSSGTGCSPDTMGSCSVCCAHVSTRTFAARIGPPQALRRAASASPSPPLEDAFVGAGESQRDGRLDRE
jgi:hypothetical protein